MKEQFIPKGLQIAAQRLSHSEKHIFCDPDGIKEVKTVRGYRRTGPLREIGVYTLFREVVTRDGVNHKKYVLTQDTLTTQPLKGVMVEDGKITIVGHEENISEKRKREIKDELFAQFNICEHFYAIEPRIKRKKR